MIQINGSVQLIPSTVHTESGTLRVDESGNTQPAVVQTLVTMSGPVQVIYPAEAITGVIEGLQTAHEEAVKKNVSDLYIPQSIEEVDNFAKQQDIIKGGEPPDPAKT